MAAQASMAPVLCVGAAHWDLIARAGRPPVPGGDLPGRILRQPGGVALNVALALAAAGVPVALRAAIGTDAAGAALRAAAAGVDLSPVLALDGPTDAYLAIEGPDGALFAAVADCRALERAGMALLPPPWPGPLVLDGNLPTALLRAVDRPRVVVAASPAKAPALRGVLAGATILCNRAEAAAICGAAFPDAAAAARGLLTHAARALVTDGAAAAALATADGVLTALPRRVAVRSVTGAGDALLAGFLAAEARGAGPAAALDAALDAAARHVAGDPA